MGVLDLTGGASKDSRFFPVDDVLVRLVGIGLIAGGIGLILRRGWGFVGSILVLILSMLEVLATTKHDASWASDGAMTLALSGAALLFFGLPVALLVWLKRVFEVRLAELRPEPNGGVEMPAATAGAIGGHSPRIWSLRRRHLRLSTVTWGVIACFLAIVVYLWNLGEPFSAEVTHVGYTNEPTSGIFYARFFVTNSGAGNITRWPEFQVEYKTSQRLKRDGDFPETVNIIPTGHETICVPVPHENVRWRVIVVCSPDCFRAAVGDLFGTMHSTRARVLFRDWLHIIPVRRVTSEWLEPATPPEGPHQPPSTSPNDRPSRA